jgi:excisionase family DNA binding protein
MPGKAAVREGRTTEAIHIARRLINVREAAQYLGRTEKSIRHLVGRRKIRSVRADGRVMLDLSDLDAWINMNRF